MTATAIDPRLVGRSSRCYCGRVEPSERVVNCMFEYRGPGTQDERCKHCKMYRNAHNPGSDLKRYGCYNFEPMTEGYEYDLHYCGCEAYS